MRGFQQRYGELKDLGARVAGVSADTWAAQAAFARENDIEFPLLSDWPEYKTIHAFGVQREQGPTAMRGTFVFDADGIVRAVIDDVTDMEAHPLGSLEAVRRLVAEAGGAK
jgi:peroxiredoxin